jgi:hypothetical protein
VSAAAFAASWFLGMKNIQKKKSVRDEETGKSPRTVGGSDEAPAEKLEQEEKAMETSATTGVLAGEETTMEDKGMKHC